MTVYGEPTKRGEFEKQIMMNAKEKAQIRITCDDGKSYDIIPMRGSEEILIAEVCEASLSLTDGEEIVAFTFDTIVSFEIIS